MRKIIGRIAQRVSIPRRTVRLQLTLLFGGLFLISGAALLGITYLLVSAQSPGAATYHGPNGFSGTVDGPIRPGGGATLNDQPNAAVTNMLEAVKATRAHDRADQLHALLTRSGLALGIMAVISVLLGWIVAGRILRRLSTITAKAREISANNLSERLSLQGPDDELRELSETFDDLLGRLETSFEAQRAFIANASHELRTPLARQRTLGQVALSDPDATVDSLRQAHERVLAAGAEQEHLIAALLDLARGQAGFQVRAPFDLAALARRAVDGGRAEARRRELTVHTRLAPAPTAGDPRLAERLITNLVDNAIKYNVQRGELEIGTDVQDGRAVLWVANSGEQIADEAVERLFQPFERLATARMSKANGLGLGLSIVAAIARAHGGTVTARPRPQGGLVVTAMLPAEPARTPRGAPDIRRGTTVG